MGSTHRHRRLPRLDLRQRPSPLVLVVQPTPRRPDDCGPEASGQLDHALAVIGTSRPRQQRLGNLSIQPVLLAAGVEVLEDVEHLVQVPQTALSGW